MSILCETEIKELEKTNSSIGIEWYGKMLVKIDKWYPSSQICSECGKNTGKKTLNIGEWTCPFCGSEHDRDINAAKNN